MISLLRFGWISLVLLGTLLPSKLQAEVTPQLTLDLLNESLKLGGEFLLANQKPEGNFNYEFDLVTGRLSEEDSPVRQAGVLWALALIHLDDPRPDTRSALEKGFSFFEKNSRPAAKGGRFIVYPGDQVGKTGTIALVSLALIDYLRVDGTRAEAQKFHKLLEDYLEFLLSIKLVDGRFAASYDFKSGAGLGAPSPYFDGECLLAFSKAWRRLGRLDLKDTVWDSAEAMHQFHVVEALKEDPDSDRTKGYFLWGCLSYYELFESREGNGEPFAQRVLDLAVWMVDVHQTLERTRNTAYAQEGILTAYAIADTLGKEELKEKFSDVIHRGLFRLTTWQVGGSVENEYLVGLKPVANAKGGVLNQKDRPLLRLDVTQHQMHAVLLARDFLFHRGENP